MVKRPNRLAASCALLLAALALQSSLAAPAAQPSDPEHVALGRVPAGAAVTFTRTSSGWGLAVGAPGNPELAQPEPARIQVSDGPGQVRELAAAYKTAARTGDTLDATADIEDGPGVSFHIHDLWKLTGDILSVHRTVSVHGSAAGRGFDSAILFDLAKSTAWDDVSYLAPGLLYADPTYDGERSPGGTLNFAAHHLIMREDILPAPMFGLYFKDGSSVAMLDPTPRGDTTEQESKLTEAEMTDSRFQFGSLGVWQQQAGGLQFGFRFPASTDDFSRDRRSGPPQWVRRFHPIQAGFSQTYTVSFRLAKARNFRDFSRDSWRWSWATLKPPVVPLDVLLVRRVLMDHLAAQVAQINGHAAVPFVLSTVNNDLNWNWTMSAMGFVGKDLDCADALLREGDRDPGLRGQRMRTLGLTMISTMIQALPTVPLPATGIDLVTGQPWNHIWLAPWLRNATEDMRVLMLAYRREKKLGRDHPEWIAWVRQYADWLIQQQRPDGSFPRRWAPSSNVAVEPSGTASYNAVPVLVLMSQETGDPKYRQSALRAAEYTWTNYGSRGLFIGGASDNPNITDKEAGLLSLEAFLSLYEDNKEAKWLDRARAAGDFAESWIWIWNLPMPVDADNAQLNWKRGVSTVGLQGITALSSGDVDEYLDCAVGLYARLYNYTGDPHYLDVTRVLLDDTKNMVALPGRLYDMKGPGWQQENFAMGPGPRGRGVGSHRLWLPWVSANHLHGINSLEEYDPALFRRLTANTGTPASPVAVH